MAVFLTGAGSIRGKVNFAEHLIATGTQYIDTGFYPNNNTSLKIKLSGVKSSSYNVTGCRNTTSDATNRFGLIRYSATDTYGAFYGTKSAQGPARDNAAHEFVLDKNGMVMDGIAYGSANTTSFTCTYPFLIFAWNNGSGGVQINEMIVDYCQLYDNGTLVRDYWPCYDPDGVACFYDKVNEEYVYNAGTGEFTAG